MKREIAERWVAALRSKKFKQATNRLRKQEKGEATFCVLGVLCEIAREDGITEVIPSGIGYEDEWGSYSTTSLPSRVRSWSGLRSAEARVPRLNSYLTYLNDRGDSFEELADIIEANVDSL